jgi:hypothetical protein
MLECSQPAGRRATRTLPIAPAVQAQAIACGATCSIGLGSDVHSRFLPSLTQLALDPAFAATEGNAGSASVQAQGCKALRNLAHGNDGRATAAQLALAEAGAHDALVLAMVARKDERALLWHVSSPHSTSLPVLK